MLLVFFNRRQVDRAQTLNTRIQLGQLLLPVGLGRPFRQGLNNAVEIVPRLQQLFLQPLTTSLQITGVEALLVQLFTQNLSLLLGLHAAGFLCPHLLVDCLQLVPRSSQLMLDINPLLQQGFQLNALIVFRCLALFQRHAQLLTALAQSLGLHLLPLQALRRAVLLRLERLYPQGHLM